jgi:hypothetical protein
MTPFSNRLVRCALVVATSTALASCGAGNAPTVAPRSPAASVQLATELTLRQRSAAVTITGTVKVGLTRAAITGTGQADFTNSAFAGLLTTAPPGMTLQQQLVAADGHAYMRLVLDGLEIGPLTHGRDWILMSTYASGGAYSLGGGNPLPQLRLLTETGNTVSPLGTTSVNGVQVSGYSVTIAPSVIVREFRRELSLPGLTPAEARQIRGALTSPVARSLTIQVWFDRSGLMRRMTTRSMWGGTPVTTAALTMTVTGYGPPVNIKAPASSKVLSYAQFLRAAERLRRPPPQ